nr:ribonuclease H-like domain-containing protein [Tanacetum cinerariifolium]
MHTIVWRNRSDLDTMSLYDLYNHLKVYAPEVQKKLDSQNMAFISSSKNSSGNEEDNTVGVPTASTQVSTTSATVAPASTSLDTACAYIASQSNGQGSKVKEQDPKALMMIDRVGWDWSFMANEEENHALIADEEAPTEFALMAKTSADSEVFDNSLCSKNCKKNTESLNKLENLKNEKEGLESKLTGFKSATKDLDHLIRSQRSDKIKEGLGYSVVPPPPAQVYSPLKKDISSSAFDNGESTGGILSKPEIKFIRPADTPTIVKTDKVETAKKPTVKYAEQYIKPSKTSNVKGNQRNWNNLKSQQLGENFVMKNRACFNCGHFDHLSYDCSLGVKKGRTCPTNTHKSTSPRPIVHKTYRPPMRPVRPNMNVAYPKRTSCHKPTHSYNKRPFQRTSAVRSQFRDPRDSGFSRHMTCNISYISDYEPFDEAYVSFRQSGCKITGKGTIKTGKIEFENVYFVNDLKYNLFSVSQICDNKNSVLFTDSECIVLGRNFKLTDDANVLLRTLRQHNMYSIDLNNIVAHKDLTCLVAKESADELTDDFSRFTWTFFFKTKDETSGILRNFITEIENLKELMVKIIRYDNRGTKEAAGQDVKKDVSSLRYIILPNWFHEAHLESSTSNAQDTYSADASES